MAQPPAKPSRTPLYGHLVGAKPDISAAPQLNSNAPGQNGGGATNADDGKAPSKATPMFKPRSQHPQSKQIPKNAPKKPGLTHTTSAGSQTSATGPAPVPVRPSFEDFAKNEYEHEAAAEEYRNRRAMQAYEQKQERKAKRKGLQRGGAYGEMENINFSALYILEKPTNMKAYLESYEKEIMDEEWRAKIQESRHPRRAAAELSSAPLQQTGVSGDGEDRTLDAPEPQFDAVDDYESGDADEVMEDAAQQVEEEDEEEPAAQEFVPANDPASYQVARDKSGRIISRGRNFAEKFMNKLGFQKGTGLGLNANGITKELSVAPTKRKRTANADGNKVLTPMTGRVLGGKRRKGNNEDKWTAVLCITGLAEGPLSDDQVMQLRQDVGDYMDPDHRQLVKRVIVEANGDDGTTAVYVQFKNPITAHTARERCHGQDILRTGKPVTASFFDEWKYKKTNNLDDEDDDY